MMALAEMSESGKQGIGADFGPRYAEKACRKAHVDGLL